MKQLYLLLLLIFLYPISIFSQVDTNRTLQDSLPKDTVRRDTVRPKPIVPRRDTIRVVENPIVQIDSTRIRDSIRIQDSLRLVQQRADSIQKKLIEEEKLKASNLKEGVRKNFTGKEHPASEFAQAAQESGQVAVAAVALSSGREPDPVIGNLHPDPVVSVGETHPPVPPETPIFDAFAYLAYLAGITEHLRLGTHVYNIGLRHPFTAARAVQTLDLVSNGRAEFGIGASWLEEEWDAVELDFQSRGKRVDEAIEICKQLWTQPETSFHGEFFSFDGAVFEPKCVQRPHPPILVGGESGAALRRAARAGDGWIGMSHDLESGAAQIAKLREALAKQDEIH